VEAFKDPMRVVVRMPFYRAVIVVRLEGVRTLTVNSKDKAIESFKRASAEFC